MLRSCLAALFAVLFLTGCDMQQLSLAASQRLGKSLSGLSLGDGTSAGSPRPPRGYERLLSTTEHGFRISTRGEPTRRGALSERYELRDGECAGSDCGNPRYRTEIRATSSAPRMNGATWFGWSFYNENIESYPRPALLKTVFGQWKYGGKTPAALRVVQIGVGEGNWDSCDPAICNRSGDDSLDVVLELTDMALAKGWGPEQNRGFVCRLFSMKKVRGTWTDIVLSTNFSKGPDGYVRAWVNGTQVCNYIGPVRVSGPDRGTPSHRRGIFVAYSTRWDNVNPGKAKPNLIAYYDEFRAGQSREEVDPRLLEAAGTKPVN